MHAENGRVVLLSSKRQLTSPSDPLDRELSASELAEVVGYFEDLLTTGHTVREALQGIETVWRDHT